jgi:hypothetical protein
MYCRRRCSQLLILLLIALLAVACGASEEDEATPTMGAMAMPDTPEELDTAMTRLTDQGVFEVTISSNLDPLILNEIHSWTVHVDSPNGDPVEAAQIGVNGGMPEHNHGFPTTPEITDELGGGDYLLEGVKFSMAGWWELTLDITSGDQHDSVTFNIVLP